MAISSIENMHEQKNTERELLWPELAEADLTLPVPFRLTLLDHKEPVYCDRVVRVLNGRRLVAFGTWNGKPVVAKLFFDLTHAKRHVKREVTGVQALTDAGVPTPTLLYQGALDNKRIQVLLFERIVESRNLDEIWCDKTDVAEVAALIQVVTLEIATQHVLGVIQHDLHFKNLLISSKHIYTLDGGSIEYLQEPLSKKRSLDHLALFFSQLGVGCDALQEKLFQFYSKARGWIIKDADTVFLQTAVKKWNHLRWQRYEKKILRHSSAFARIKTARALVMYDRDYHSSAMLNFLNHPESIFLDPTTEVLKAGRSSTVVKAVIGNKTLVVKRYNMKSPWHWLRRCLRSTRACANWKMAHLLRLFGISIAKPVAFIEKSFLGLRDKSYFVMEYVNGKHLGECFRMGSESLGYEEKIAERVTTLLNNLAALRVSHGDLKMTNILIKNDAPVLLDLDGARLHKHQQQFNKIFAKEMQRFMQNWQDQPSIQKLFR